MDQNDRDPLRPVQRRAGGQEFARVRGNQAVRGAASCLRATGQVKTQDSANAVEQYPLTLDGRYIVVRGRLWRAANPGLTREERQRLVEQLMTARRAVAAARRSGEAAALKLARNQVHAAKLALGERGAVWWTDGAPDLNRRLIHRTPYADWYAARDARKITK